MVRNTYRHTVECTRHACAHTHTHKIEDLGLNAYTNSSWLRTVQMDGAFIIILQRPSTTLNSTLEVTHTPTSRAAHLLESLSAHVVNCSMHKT